MIMIRRFINQMIIIINYNEQVRTLHYTTVSSVKLRAIDFNN